MIRHTVVFRLIHATGSDAELAFLADAAALGGIPGVQQFEVLAEVSPRNDYTFGLSMEFDDQTSYDGYRFHPVHVAFVEERWVPEVAETLEIDYAPLAL